MSMHDLRPISEIENAALYKPTEGPNGHAEDDALHPPEFADEALALRFTELHAEDLRYVAGWGRWLHWTGTRWRIDETLRTLDCARAVCRDAAARCSDKRLAPALASAKTAFAVERLARADRQHAATTEQWDADPWLLNTPGGVVDLRTGKLRRHHPSDHMTRIAAITPGGACAIWRDFLHRVTGGDLELQAFLQRMAGYMLTGDTSAHALFFAYGTGANGKSVFADALSGILGEYHRTAPVETFTASHSDRHPTELAMLRGARLVTAVETEEGRRWAESKIKSLTGGDKISARFMRQDFFEYAPQFKLLIVGNHKPGLRSVDEAIRRRFHLLPFAVTIPPEDRDPHLRDKLRAEWPGILAWMIDGCLDYQRMGLSPPRAVVEATVAYLNGEDGFSAWLDDCCTRDSLSWAPSAKLFGSWKEWAEQAGEHVGTAKRFAQTLEARGFEPRRSSTGRGFLGLSLVTGRSQ